jgi:DNA-directed RNA polymerase specialized sigma24 family protein
MALVRRCEAAIFRLAVALLGHREDAEDATQDTFVLAFRRLQTLRTQIPSHSGCVGWQFAYA